MRLGTLRFSPWLQARLVMRSIAHGLVTLSLIATASPALAAWPHSPFTNLPVSTAANDQFSPTIVTDGGAPTGGGSGAIVAWQDFRSGNYDIYVQHMLASGAVDPAWPAGGRALCTAANDQLSPTIVTDGAGGAIVTWYDFRSGNYDIYAQHVLASGAVDPAWPADGRALCTAASEQAAPTIATDGAGGAIVTWYDFRSGTSYDIYAQHVLASGVVDPAWPADGRALCTAANTQFSPTIVTDDVGGAIVTWYDYRSGTSDIYAQHVLASGAVDPAWPAGGRALCTAVNTQYSPTIVTDGGAPTGGASGAVVAWYDLRSGNFDIYAQHVLASGAVDPAWPADGRALCTAASEQSHSTMVTDGTGGAIVTWTDYRNLGGSDIYAQHVLASGAVDPAWPVDGRALCTAGSVQLYPTIATDGAGGAIVTWSDERGGVNDDIYAQHVLASGAVDPAWPADGRALCTAGNDQYSPTIVTDGGSGAIVTWHDARSGNYDIYAQRVARHGYLGTPEAEIVSAKDVPNDQGGRVKLSWNASWLDPAQDPNLAAYDVYRSVPPNLAAAARESGALRVLREGDPGMHRPGELVMIPASATTYAWEYVQSVTPNHFASQYSVLAPTAFDSLGGSNPETAFLVLARNASGSMFWPSRPDSGYSVDNLGPAMPAPFAGQYAAGVVHLHWNPNTESDLGGYRLYRGTSAGFPPDAASLIAALADTGYTDPAGAPYWYKLTAVDVHGNESQVATLLPSGTVDVESGVVPRALMLAPATPNPAAGRTTLRYGLPRAGVVRLAVYDAVGRLVRELAGGIQNAGEHAVEWDLRDARGHAVGAGLYFARIEAEGRTLVRRVAVTR